MMVLVGEIAAFGTACLWGLSTFMHTDAAKLMGARFLTLFRMPLVVFYNLCLAGLFGISWSLPGDSLFWLIFSGVLGLGIADTLLYEGCTRIGARLGSIIWQLTPCVTALIAYFFLGETLSIHNIVGMAVVMGAVLYVITEKDRSRQDHSDPVEWRRGILLTLLSMITLACSHVCIRKGLSYGVDPLMGCIVRAVAAAIVSWSIVVFLRRTHYVIDQLRSSRNALSIVLVASFFGTTIGNWLALVAMKYAKAGIAATLIGMSPLAVIALTSMRERRCPTLRVVFGSLVACAGSALMFWK
jgi:drug/metabolite transporter (DMT)-like permease